MVGETFQTCQAHSALEHGMGAVEEGVKNLREDFRDFKEDLRAFETRYSMQIGDIANAIRQNSESLRVCLDETRRAVSPKEKGFFLEFIAGNLAKKILFGSAGASVFYSAMHFLFKHLQW